MRRSGERFVLTCVILAGGVVSLARADEETAAVRAAAREYAAAVANGDAEKVRDAWTKDGDYVDASGRTRKVSNVVKQMARRPRDGKARANVSLPKSSLRFVAPTVAIEDGEYECGDAPDGSPLSGRFTAVWVKQNGRWVLDSLRESVAAGPQIDKHLRPLEWLLGEWVAETDDAVVLVSARPSDRGNYIVREFAVIGDGGATTATERIAWDADDGELKSWTFDSQDGRSESTWTRDGKGWRVETKETMDDEQPATTVATITPDVRGQHVWEVKSSKVGDESLPTQKVTFRRAPE